MSEELVVDRRTDEQRRLDMLRAVAAAGGTLTPRRNPFAKNGHDFTDLGEDSDVELRYLSDRDYLEARYFDRVTICPQCFSHHLNIREICPTCKSSHHVEEPLIHHFRCGYVGRVTEFTPPEGGPKRICPKCTTQLKFLGTDHDVIGKTFLCIDCGSSFQDPPASGVCLACNQETDAADLLGVEINGYSLTSLGSSAIRRGTLFEHDGEVVYIAGAPVFRRAVMAELLAQEAKRIARFKAEFALMIIEIRETGRGPVDIEIEADMLNRLRERLRTCDVIGQLSDHRYVVCMPQTPLKGAQIVLSRFLESTDDPRFGIEAEVVEIKKPEDLEPALIKRRR